MKRDIFHGSNDHSSRARASPASGARVPTGWQGCPYKFPQRGRDPLPGSSPPAFLGAVARAGSGAVEEVRTAVLA